MFSPGALSVSALVFCVLDVIMCVIYIRASILLPSCMSFSTVHTFHIYSFIFWQSAFFVPQRIFIDVII